MLATNLQVRVFHITCDSLSVVKRIQGEGLGQYGHIVQEIKVATAGLEKVEFVYEGWANNFDAHRLPRSSVSYALGRHVLFLLDLPDGIRILYSLDV